MAKIYRYLNGLNNEVEQLEVEVDDIQEYLTKLKSDEKVVVPLSKNYVTTRAIKLRLGYEIDEHEISIAKIAITDRNGDRIDSSDTNLHVTKIEIENSIEQYKSRQTALLCDDFNSELESIAKRYVVSKHNPTIIKIYFNDLVDVKEIDIYTKRKADPCEAPYSYTCMSAEYLHEELTAERGEEIWYGIEYLPDKFTPENGIYCVDFSMIEGVRIEGLQLPNDDNLITMKQLNQILQDYVRTNELGEFLQEDYDKIVAAAVNAAIPEVLKYIGGKKYM